MSIPLGRGIAEDVSLLTTNWVASGINIDAEHPGEFVPFAPPNAARGAELWAGLSEHPLSDIFSDTDLRLLIPAPPAPGCRNPPAPPPA